MGESRVCFVVTELLGLVRNGGIATVTTHAGLVLNDAGYDVTLFYCGHEPVMEPEWEQRYDEAGVTVRWLDRSQGAHPPFLADSFRLYQELKDSGFDAIVFQDWQGLGYSSVTAKQTGLAFAVTRLIHICHGPDQWLRLANRQLMLDGVQLTQAHLERRSAELADAVVSPSAYLLGWMADAGWSLPASQHVIPNFTEQATRRTQGATSVKPAPASPGQPEALRELVFFGRLEERKGVRLFAGALNLLGPDLLHGVGVTFLGREASFTGDQVVALIDPLVRERLGTLAFHGNLDQAGARAYLREPGRLAVIPSYIDNSPSVVYECIEDRVPFLASNAGGTGELVAEADRPATLFDPTPLSLATALRPLVEGRELRPPARPAFSGSASLAAWKPLLAPPPEPVPVAAGSPLVSVVIVHYNQAHLIRSTIESVAAQDYENLEIILVDDGSSDPEAVAVLNELEAHDWGHSFRLVRQQNRYLGAARNAGAQHAAGEYVAYVDDDDSVDPAYLRSMVTAATATGADAVTVAIHAIEADDRGQVVPNPEETVWCFLGDAPQLGTMDNVFGGAAALYRKDVLVGAGGFFEHHGVGHEDWEMLARLSLSGARVVSVPEPLYRYRVRPKSMLRSTSVYANMQPVFESYRQNLPDSLASWPELTRGQQAMINWLREEVGVLKADRDRMAAALDQRERYLAVLRRAIAARQP